MIFISLYIDYIIDIKDLGLDSQCTRRIFGLGRHCTYCSENLVLIGIVLMEMTGMTGYYRKRPEMTANDRT
jgi:hypothetical protein